MLRRSRLTKEESERKNLKSIISTLKLKGFFPGNVLRIWFCQQFCMDSRQNHISCKLMPVLFA